MKQIYMSVLLVMLFTVNVFGEQHASKFGEKEKVAVVYENNVFLKAEPRNSVDDALDRKSTRLNSSHASKSRMPSSA